MQLSFSESLAGRTCCARMKVMDVGIIIVSYNTKDLLRRCLESVSSSVGVSFSVCVVDNGSTDGSVEMIREDFPDVYLIDNDENVGYPAANNQGLKCLGFDTATIASAPDYALLLNPDTEMQPDVLRKVIAYANDNAQIGVLGPKLVRLDGSLDMACRRSFPTPAVSFYRLIGLSKLFPKHHLFGKYNLTFLDENEIADVDSVVGAFMLVRRQAIQQVGLLDEAFFMYGEDLDWAYRIKAIGYRVVYYPEVTVLHVKRASSRQFPRSKVEFWRAMEIFYRKYYAKNTPLLFHVIIIITVRLLTTFMQWRIKIFH
jgi:N-acetylglucosaminyl-diphospho-decaprenol L-rhamnosyltransferase